MRRVTAGFTSAFAMVGLLGIGATNAAADSISPTSFSATIGVGGTTSVHKTVTVTQSTAAPVDIFFLVDTTGSMGSVISSVRSGFSSIVSAISGIASNVAFGVGEYKDTFDAFRYRENLDLTTNTAAVQTALNGLGAVGGGDTPEANLFALNGAATNTSWRAGSQRLMVWVGDAPGHDPSGGVTEAIATTALTSNGIEVYAASTTTGPGLNAACGPATSEGGSCTTGQANRITAATGGQFLGNFAAGSVVTAITNALTTGISTYSSVGLSLVGAPAGVNVNIPAAITGSFDRSIDRIFNFDVDFTGVAPGTYAFEIAALVDGRAVATESDVITVTGAGGDPTVPEPVTLSMLALGLAATAAARRRAA